MPPLKQKIAYSPESIKISFVLSDPAGVLRGDSVKTQNPAQQGRGGETEPLKENETSFSLNYFEFVSLRNAPQKEKIQTFQIILPNLIHKQRTIFHKKKKKKI